MPRRRRHTRVGRPTTQAADQPIAELGLALEIRFGLSQRHALTLAVAWCEGEPTRLPDWAGRPRVSYRLSNKKRSIDGRVSTIRKKLKSGTLHPDPTRVVKLVLAR